MNTAIHSPAVTNEVLAFVALGSNLDNPLLQIDSACLAIAKHAKMTPIKMSRVYQSRPHGSVSQPNFINAVLLISTSLSPASLLSALQTIENAQGRQRDVVWGPRTLDLDIILYAQQTTQSPELTIPHPRAREREFVLYPLMDLDTSLNIPGQGFVADLIKLLPTDTMEIIRDVTTDYH